MDDYGLYTLNRQWIRWIGSKAKGVVCNRYTFTLLFLSLCFLPGGANLPVQFFSGIIFAVIVDSVRSTHCDALSPYREDRWIEVKQLNHQLAYLFLVGSIVCIGTNVIYGVPIDELNTVTLVQAVILLLYAGIYVTHAIGIYEYRYKKESR